MISIQNQTGYSSPRWDMIASAFPSYVPSKPRSTSGMYRHCAPPVSAVSFPILQIKGVSTFFRSHRRPPVIAVDLSQVNSLNADLPVQGHHKHIMPLPHDLLPGQRYSPLQIIYGNGLHSLFFIWSSWFMAYSYIILSLQRFPFSACFLPES